MIIAIEESITRDARTKLEMNSSLEPLIQWEEEGVKRGGAIYSRWSGTKEADR